MTGASGTGLRPANELETKLFTAVEHGDLETYVHLLRSATVVLPAASASARPGPDGTGWPLTTVDGLLHVPVFTSRETMVANPGYRNLAHVELTLEELAGIWPNPEWRLAVNAGLPVGVYLPGSFVLMIGKRPGAKDPVAELQLPDIRLDGFASIRMGQFEVENVAEQRLVEALTAGDKEKALRALLEASLFIVSTENDGYTLPGQPGFRWLTVTMGEQEAVPLFTSRNRVDQSLRGGMQTKLPARLLDLAEAWPGADLPLMLNPGTPLTLILPGPGVLGIPGLAQAYGIERAESGFQPCAAPDPVTFQTPALSLSLHHTPGATIDSRVAEEHALLEVASRGDREAYLTTLFGTKLYVPIAKDHDFSVRYTDPGFPWETSTVGGRPAIQVFTSPNLRRELTGTTGAVDGELSNVLRYWPDASLDLAINPGSPIGAVLPGDQVFALSTWYDQATAHELAKSFPVTGRIDLQLLDAARRGDRNGFLEMLRQVKLQVPAYAKGLAYNTPPTDPSFPWNPVPVRGRPSMLVFTELEWRKRTIKTGTTVTVVFDDLAAAWPGGRDAAPGPDLVLNPASPVSVTLTAEDVRAFGRGGEL